MKQLEGWELVSLTDTEIVQRKYVGKGGCSYITITGNPNPDPAEHKKCADDLATFLYNCVEKAKARKSLLEEHQRAEEEHINNYEL